MTAHSEAMPTAVAGRPSRPAWVDGSEYPFSDRMLALPAGAIHYIDEGKGEPILFVHGTPTWSFDWRHLVRGLAPSHRCIAPDHLGFGLSERPRDFPYTPEAHAANLAAFVERLGLDRFTLVVHDYGGPIGLPLALEHPDRVTRLVLINTWMWSFADDRDMVRKGRLAGSAFGRFLYRRLNASLRLITPHAFGDRRKLTPALHRQYLAPFPDAWSRGAVLWPLARALLGASAYYDSLWQRRDRLAGKPALVVWGMRDPAFPPRMLELWRQALPQAEVVPIEEAGHWPHEEDPQAVVTAVRHFLNRPA
jgi:haloalkane dehalogenase